MFVVFRSIMITVFKHCIEKLVQKLFDKIRTFDSQVIFTSPKINPAVINDLNASTDDIVSVLKNLNLNYKIRIIANEDFSDKVLEPVLNVLGDLQIHQSYL